LSQLSGVITDQSGVVIANAAVTLTHTQTHTKRETTTDGQGHFEFSELPTGDYF